LEQHGYTAIIHDNDMLHNHVIKPFAGADQGVCHWLHVVALAYCTFCVILTSNTSIFALSKRYNINNVLDKTILHKIKRRRRRRGRREKERIT